MSSTPARRRRLAVARTFPQAHCPRCDAPLDRVDFPAKHLARCEARAAAAVAVSELYQVPLELINPMRRPSLWQRLLARLSMTTRGAAE